VALLPLCVDELIPPQHQARTLWALVEGLDLSGFQEEVKARASEPGRAATDPKILVALWLWAATQGVGSLRQTGQDATLWTTGCWNGQRFAHLPIIGRNHGYAVGAERLPFVFP
jgi:transposase